MLTTQKYCIDESHGLAHSMDVLHYANQIFEHEKIGDFRLENRKKLFTYQQLYTICVIKNI